MLMIPYRLYQPRPGLIFQTFFFKYAFNFFTTAVDSQNCHKDSATFLYNPHPVVYLINILVIIILYILYIIIYIIILTYWYGTRVAINKPILLHYY